MHPEAADPAALNFWPRSGASPRPVYGVGAGAAALRARLYDSGREGVRPQAL